MKHLTRWLGFCLMALAVYGCGNERVVVECRLGDTCQAGDQTFVVTYKAGTQHDFTLQVEGDGVRLEKADIVGVNMEMGVFPLFVEHKGARVHVKGITPVCTLGDAMRWKVRLYTPSHRIEVSLP
ncbi:MAG: hypothetical protein D6758_03080 [Gammaproteobacteria bacterium]|nr:MAG: hypothetical protein D6758_03080 [Gammaproteobacteria bacterium]